MKRMWTHHAKLVNHVIFGYLTFRQVHVYPAASQIGSTGFASFPAKAQAARAIWVRCRSGWQHCKCPQLADVRLQEENICHHVNICGTYVNTIWCLEPSTSQTQQNCDCFRVLYFNIFDILQPNPKIVRCGRIWYRPCSIDRCTLRVCVHCPASAQTFITAV